MIASLKRHASRVTLDRSKFVFSVRVTQIVIDETCEIQPGSILTVSFQKGEKISTAGHIMYDVDHSDGNPLATHGLHQRCTISVDQRLELLVTLFKTRNGDYQKRTAKIMLRQLQHNASIGVDAFKAVGVYELNLHDLAQALGTQRKHCVEVTADVAGLSGCSLQLAVTVRAAPNSANKASSLGSMSALSFGRLAGMKTESDELHETRSTGSAESDDSTFSNLGATFYYDDFDQFTAGGMDAVVGLTGTTLSLSEGDYKRRTSAGGGSGMDAVFLDDASLQSLKGPMRRRSSGLHVMELALQGGDQERIGARVMHKRITGRSQPLPPHSPVTSDETQSEAIPNSTVGSPGDDLTAREEPSAPATTTTATTAEDASRRFSTAADGGWTPVLTGRPSNASSPIASRRTSSAPSYSPYGSPVSRYRTMWAVHCVLWCMLCLSKCISSSKGTLLLYIPNLN